MRMTAAEVARIVGGTVEGDSGVLLVGAEVDSRHLEPGGLFVALPGEHRDGHAFVSQALEIGGAALVRRDEQLAPPPAGTALVRVENPLHACWALARHERVSRAWTVVAVTGSVGKTTVKEFTADLLDRHRPTGRSRGNRNNTLGLPGQILSQTAEVEVFVAETGMSRPGELDALGAILEPLQVLVYSRIAPAHTEFFPGIEGIVRAKAELLPHLSPSGTLVINADDPNQQDFPSRVAAAAVRFGGADGDVRLEAFEDRGLLGSRFDLVVGGRSVAVELSVVGRHQAENLLAAAAAAHALGVTPDQIAAAAATLRAMPHRGRLIRVGDAITLLDDSYNASPVAVDRMLDVLAGMRGRRVAVLGEMYELGALTDEAHRAAGRRAAGACDLLVAVGGAAAGELVAAARSAGLKAVHHVVGAEAAAELLAAVLLDGDVVLIKGSRGVGLDRTVTALVGEEAA